MNQHLPDDGSNRNHTAVVQPFDSRYTCGAWADEPASVHAFDQAIERLGMFVIYREVVGRYQHLRPCQDLKTPRIDRILVPNSELVAHGWDLGPVGVECKRSGEKTGPPISQLLDYTRAAWKLGHTWVVPEWYFLWPLETVKSTLESIFAQQRIGGIHLDQRGKVVFHSRGIIAKMAPGEPDFRGRNTASGRKTGSR